MESTKKYGFTVRTIDEEVIRKMDAIRAIGIVHAARNSVAQAAFLRGVEVLYQEMVGGEEQFRGRPEDADEEIKELAAEVNKTVANVRANPWRRG